MEEKKIAFMNQSGDELVGYLHESSSGKAVILSHGFTGDKSEFGKFDKVANRLNKSGLAVLRFDYGGCGESYDSPLTVAGQVEDLKAAIRFVKSKGYKEIGLLGYSLGGLIVLKIKDYSVKSIVLWAPVIDSEDIETNYTPKQLKELKLKGYMTLEKERKWKNTMIVPEQMFKERCEVDQEKLLKNVSLPVLIIHGDNDESVPLTDSKNANKILKNSKLEILKSSNHYFTGFEDKIVELSDSWFKKWLK